MNLPAAGDIIFIGLRQVIWMEKLFVPVQKVIEQVNRVILGKEREVREIMLAFLANGHVLLEDIPGVGKTTLALAFSRAMELEYRRIQFTPDVLPSVRFSAYPGNPAPAVPALFSCSCRLPAAAPAHSQFPANPSGSLLLSPVSLPPFSPPECRRTAAPPAVRKSQSLLRSVPAPFSR